MTTLINCLDNAVAGDAADPTLANEAKRRYEELYQAYRGQMGDLEAASKAASETKKTIKAKNAADARTKFAQAMANINLANQINAHTNLQGKFDPAEAIQQLGAVRGKGKQGIEELTQSNVKMNARRIEEFLNKHTSDLLGRTRAKEDLEQVGRALAGEQVQDQRAAGTARAVRELLDEQRLRLNSEGADIGEIDNWLPQRWNKSGLSKLSDTPEGRAEFVEDMVRTQDWNRVINPETGKPFGQPNRAFLRAALDGLTGKRAKEVTSSPGGASLATRLSEGRVLHFKSYDDWHEMMGKYGTNDLFQLINSHMQNTSRDLAMMQVYGPNPVSGQQFAMNYARERAKDLPKAQRDKVDRKITAATNVFNRQRGAANEPVSEFWANLMANTRNYLGAALLDRAIASAVSDTASVGFNAAFSGVNGGKVLARAVRISTDGQTKEDLRRTLGVLETVLQTNAAMARDMGEMMGSELSKRFASGVIRAQGLAQWTDSLRASFEMEFMGLLASNKGRGWNTLPKRLRDTFQERGISQGDWEVIRSTPLFEGNTGKFLVPDDIRARTDIDKKTAEDVSQRIQAVIQQELEFVVPSSDVRAREAFLGGSQPGTFNGELARSFLQFKGFGISYAVGQIVRAQTVYHRTGGGLQGAAWTAAYLGPMLAGMTFLGAIAMTIKDVLKGNDPREPNSKEYWGAAFMQGGGFGIFGDFLFADHNRFGGGIEQAVGGPTAGLAGDVLGLTIGNLAQVIDGKETNFGREAARFVQKMAPGGQLAPFGPMPDKWIWEPLQQILDPEAEDYFRKSLNRQRSEFGNDAFWPKGELLPERAPSF